MRLAMRLLAAGSQLVSTAPYKYIFTVNGLNQVLIMIFMWLHRMQRQHQISVSSVTKIDAATSSNAAPTIVSLAAIDLADTTAADSFSNQTVMNANDSDGRWHVWHQWQV